MKKIIVLLIKIISKAWMVFIVPKKKKARRIIIALVRKFIIAIFIFKYLLIRRLKMVIPPLEKPFLYISPFVIPQIIPAKIIKRKELLGI